MIGNGNMIFVISLGNIVVSRVWDRAEQKHWQNAFQMISEPDHDCQH